LADASGVSRLVVSGILAGEQEQVLEQAATAAGFAARRRVYEAEWVSVEFLSRAPSNLAFAASAPSDSASLGSGVEEP
jgi:hypothetical protein